MIVVQENVFIAHPFADELEMRTWLETHMSSVLGLTYIGSEIILGGYRIDTLAYDERSNNFVIFEFKNNKSPGMLEQGLAYLQLAKSNIKSLMFDYANVKHNSVDVKYDSTSLILVSQQFTNHQIDISSMLPLVKWLQLERFKDKNGKVAVHARYIRDNAPKPINGHTSNRKS